MSHRKKIEYRLENDCKNCFESHLELIESSISGYRWKLTIDRTDYEINYSDLGYIALSSLPLGGYSTSEIREVYHGDNSESSYQRMIDILSDNLLDHWV
jgi:predicted secreted protein